MEEVQTVGRQQLAYPSGYGEGLLIPCALHAQVRILPSTSLPVCWFPWEPPPPPCGAEGAAPSRLCWGVCWQSPVQVTISHVAADDCGGGDYCNLGVSTRASVV